MAITFHESSVPAETIGTGVQRQRLLTKQRVATTRILLDRLTLGAGAGIALNVAAGGLGWFQMLGGSAELDSGGTRQPLHDHHVAFLPPGYHGRLATSSGATLLYAEVPDAHSLDPNFASNPTPFRLIDWSREPLLDSMNDARKRIYLATPKLFGNKAIKGEMIIYPPGTNGANHHHVGADHFMYFTAGSGTAYANELPFRVKKGDIVYFPDLERHFLRSDDDAEMVFVEFFAPGQYETIWVEGKACTWGPTGRDIRGGAPVREIKLHSGKGEIPVDV